MEDLGQNRWPLVENKKQDFLSSAEGSRASRNGHSFSFDDNFVIEFWGCRHAAQTKTEWVSLQ